MTDIIDRLRGQEPLELGDRLAAATEIDRRRAENAIMRELLRGLTHTHGGADHAVIAAAEKTLAARYRRLEAGEIIRESDEIDCCRDQWRDDPVWRPVTACIGEPAPDPQYVSHRQYRRYEAVLKGEVE